MITNIKWGTYLFFAAVNACFFPIIWFVYSPPCSTYASQLTRPRFFYPETKDRSLEEIDIIFAKGYVENMTYVNAAKQLPFLTNAEIDQKAREYGFNMEEEEGAYHVEKGDSSSRGSSQGAKREGSQVV